VKKLSKEKTILLMDLRGQDVSSPHSVRQPREEKKARKIRKPLNNSNIKNARYTVVIR
jgi:hypothetical protein